MNVKRLTAVGGIVLSLIVFQNCSEQKFSTLNSGTSNALDLSSNSNPDRSTPDSSTNQTDGSTANLDQICAQNPIVTNFSVIYPSLLNDPTNVCFAESASGSIIRRDVDSYLLNVHLAHNYKGKLDLVLPASLDAQTIFHINRSISDIGLVISLNGSQKIFFKNGAELTVPARLNNQIKFVDGSLTQVGVPLISRVNTGGILNYVFSEIPTVCSVESANLGNCNFVGTLMDDKIFVTNPSHFVSGWERNFDALVNATFLGGRGDDLYLLIMDSQLTPRTSQVIDVEGSNTVHFVRGSRSHTYDCKTDHLGVDALQIKSGVQTLQIMGANSFSYRLDYRTQLLSWDEFKNSLSIVCH